jgi:hypothetical protein
MKKTSIIVFGIAIALIVVVTAYNDMIYISFPLPEGIYEMDNGSQRVYTQFKEGYATVYVFVRENGSVRYGARYTLKANARGYNHLLGNLYFKSESLFSLRSVKDGEHRARLFLDTKSVVGYDFVNKREFEPIKNTYQGYWAFGAFPKYIEISGQRGDLVNSISSEYSNYVKKLNTLD